MIMIVVSLTQNGQIIFIQPQHPLMGSYQNLPPRAPLPSFNPSLHEFQSTYIQRIKQTPFSHSEPYSIEPSVFIDPVGIRMRDLLAPRVATHQLFPPAEVVKIARNVIGGLGELQERGFQAHGDLSTDTIYYDKRTKNFKITHPVFSPESAYTLSSQHRRFSLLSPEQLLALTDPSSHQSNLTSIKSDLFVFGVILCEICTLLPSSEIYCPDTYVIFDKEIQNRIELVREYYRGEPQICEKIVRILGYLLEYDEAKRKDPKQLLWHTQDNEKKPQLPVVTNRKLQYATPTTMIRN